MNEGGEPLGVLAVTTKNGQLFISTSPLPEYDEDDWVKKYLRLVSNFVAERKSDDRDRDSDSDEAVSTKLKWRKKAKSLAKR